jgi:hypothetical protein
MVANIEMGVRDIDGKCCVLGGMLGEKSNEAHRKCKECAVITR